MLLWIGIILLLLLVAGGLTLALLRAKGGHEDRKGHLLEVYLAQLDEVERDLKRGLIDEAAAEAARTEVSRRILKLEEEPETPAATSGLRRRALAPLLGLLIAAGALGLYLALGSPDTPSLPYADRGAEREAAAQQRASEAPFLEAVNRLQNAVKENPEDAEAWYGLGQLQVRIGEPERALSSLRRAAGLEPGEADYQAALAEALILAGGGSAGPEAREAIERALALDPGNPRARFFKAMSLVEDGRRDEGLELLILLLREVPREAPWLPSVLETAQGLAQELGRDLPQDVASLRAPSAAPQMQGGGLEGMSEEQQAMVQEMVSGLAARLEEEPDDLAGWERLARSYGVLGEDQKAAEAQAQIARLKPDDAQAQIAAGLSLVRAGRAAGEPLPPDAEALFERALELQPDSVDARFFLGEYAYQRGEVERVRALWQPLIEALPADTEIGAFLRQRLEALPEQ
jgi:cytochrome c-type biogenesis protein CcmH